MDIMVIELEEIFKERIPLLQKLIQIPSVYDADTVEEGKPYGAGVAQALDFVKNMAIEDGFEVLSYDGHAIAVVYGQGERRIDIASHLDVVEPGTGWTKEPFGGVIEDGKLYGRGTQDMKSSAFLCYLVFLAMKRQGIKPDVELRLVFGCDEERTMDDMLYYLSKAGQPHFAFTPDGAFPMAIGEKGALMWRIKGNYVGKVKSVHAGVQCNVISPCANAVLNGTDQAKLIENFAAQHGIAATVKVENGETILSVTGKAAHASRPEKGHSATADLFACLAETKDPFFQNLSDCFGDLYGEGAGLATKEAKGALTMNLGVFRLEDGECYGEVDCRYPAGISSKDCTKHLKEKCVLEVSLDYDSVPTLEDEQDTYVKGLLAAYRQHTKDEREPFVSGGVSYSKVFEHCVAYGPMFPWDEFLAHKADEYISLETCRRAFEIYYDAIVVFLCNCAE